MLNEEIFKILVPCVNQKIANCMLSNLPNYDINIIAVKAASTAKSKAKFKPTSKQELIRFYGMHMLIENTYGIIFLYFIFLVFLIIFQEMK